MSGSSEESTASHDALGTEFRYYGAAIRNLAPILSNVQDREKIVGWAKKLFAAEYHVEALRDKRNRYLASLTVNAINDELIGIFEKEAPIGVTKDPLVVPVKNAPCAEWELDATWSEYVAALPDDRERVMCSFHGRVGVEEEGGLICEPGYALEMDEQLDNEFWFLLYQIRPLAAAMPCPDAKTMVAAWIQTLCRISCTECAQMKGLRNDYAYALYGYVHDLRVAGPFQDYPPWKYLRALQDAANRTNGSTRSPLTSPYCRDVESFLSTQPTPEEGAFCYAVITGDFAVGSDIDRLIG